MTDTAAIDTIDLSTEHAAIVCAVLAAHLPDAVTVSVYGSRAKGKARRCSDLDLALQAEGPLDPSMLGDLAEAFDDSALPWKVDLLDWASTSEHFRTLIAPNLRLLRPGRPG